MKNVKKCIFIAGITYMSLILVLIICFFVFKRPYVNLVTPERVSNDFISLKEEINKLDEGNCKTELLRLYDKYESTNYDGKVKLKSLYGYIDSENIVNDYETIRDTCNFSNSQISKYGIANKYMVKMALQDKIISTYLYQYELGFTDELSIPYDEGMASFAFRVLKYTEVELLEDYLMMLEEN